MHKFTFVSCFLALVMTLHASEENTSMAFRTDGPLVVWSGSEPNSSKVIKTDEELRREICGLVPVASWIQKAQYSPGKRYIVVKAPQDILDLVKEYLQASSASLPLQMERAKAFLKATRDLSTLKKAEVVAKDGWFPWQPLSYYASILVTGSTHSQQRLQDFDAAYQRWSAFLETEIRAYELSLKTTKPEQSHASDGVPAAR